MWLLSNCVYVKILAVYTCNLLDIHSSQVHTTFLTHVHTQLTGTDILDRDPLKNKLFPSHNHVIIPYCSSDLWLGNETGGEECSCFNFTCNNFNPTSEGLGQFTFRGMRIFKSVFRQLTDDYGLRVATELVLAGSSVGGVGVVNNAKWVREQLGVGTELLVLFDSAWFVNFQGKWVEQEFNLCTL